MKTLKPLLLITLLTSTFLLADTVNRAPVGQRAVSKEVAMQMEADKATMEQEDEGEEQTAGYIFDRYPPVYYSSSHHWLNSITVLDFNQYTLELEDGSVWKIHSYDGAKALNWRANDPLTITQNSRWFSKHNHKIINKISGSSVEATLFLGPIELGTYSKYIQRIDYPRNEIFLNDNTAWEISSLDSYIFSDWAPNDYIIIGSNSNYSIWDSGSDAILINVNMNTTVRAKQF